MASNMGQRALSAASLGLILSAVAFSARSSDLVVSWETFGPTGTTAGQTAEILSYNGELVIGGSFQTFDGITANSIVQFDGLTYRSIGDGPGGQIFALAEFEGDIIAGGSFLDPGDVQPTGIRRWNGSEWTRMGDGLGAMVFALAVYQGELYAGGIIVGTTTNSLRGLVKWSGSEWIEISPGTVSTIDALLEFDGRLMVSANLTGLGGLAVLAWNGAEWDTIAPDTPGQEFVQYQGGLVFNGKAIEIDGDEVRQILRWDGESIVPLGNGVGAGMTELIRDLSVIDGQLICAGGVVEPGIPRSGFMELWNGSEWTPYLPHISAPDGEIHGIEQILGETYLMGGFSMIGGEGASRFARWEQDSWRHPGPRATGLDGLVNSTVVVGNDLIVTGSFRHAGSLRVNRVARWDGFRWHAMGDGFDDAGYVAATYLGLPVIGGFFERSGETLLNHIGMWVGDRWFSFGSGALGTGVDAPVLSLITEGTRLYAGGDFSRAGDVAASKVASWTGTHWEAMGGGLDGPAFSLQRFESQILAGIANHMLAWTGEQWEPFAEMAGAAWDMTESDGDLIIAGPFSGVGGVPASNVARWNGTSWAPMGAGLPDMVWSIHELDGRLFAGGNFAAPDLSAARRIAVWDGSDWGPVPAGTDDIVRHLNSYDGRLVAGGQFTAVGDDRSAGIAIAEISSAVPVVSLTLSALAADEGIWLRWESIPIAMDHLDLWRSDEQGRAYVLHRWNGTSLSGVESWLDQSVLPEVEYEYWLVGQIGDSRLFSQKAIARVESSLRLTLEVGPNPFRTTTRIRFNAVRGGNLELAVFDVRGRRIRTLLTTSTGEVAGVTSWDGRDEIGHRVAAGVYFVRLETSVGKRVKSVTVNR